MPFSESNECPFCGSPGRVCENPGCGRGREQDESAVQIIDAVVPVSERVRLLERKAEIERGRAIIADQIAKFQFRKCGRMSKTLRANDTYLRGQLVQVQNELALLRAKRKA